VTTLHAPNQIGPFEWTVLPSGVEVFYRESDHSYWRGLKKKKGEWAGSGRLTGVSTVCGPFDFRPDPLLRWVERLTLEGISRGFGGQAVPGDPHELRQALDAAGLRWEQLRDDAAARGNNVHKQMLHALAAGDEVPDLASLPDGQRGYGQGIMQWWLDRDPEVLQAEQVVCGPEDGFAGRLDLRCRINNGFVSETVIVDAKTGGFIPTKAHAQLAGYDLGCVQSGFGPADRLVILQVSDTGTYTEVPVQATHEDFRAGLEVYRRAGDLQNKIRAQQRTDTAAGTVAA